MRTRCPECGTIFRVTSEQLRLRAGKVRCGHCQVVFNAFDGMLPESAELAATPTGAAQAPVAPANPPPPTPSPTPVPTPPPEPVPGPETEAVRELPFPLPEKASPPEPSEDAAELARAAGLAAARELSLAPAHDRWAAGTLAGTGLDAFANDAGRRTVWPYVVAALLLALLLAGQALFQFRGALVQRFPGSAALYRLAAVDVPLPRNPELVAIESSDLQFDNGRGLFVLQATLHNRAAFEQAWPALELSLTDTNDAIVARRVIFPAEYLPAELAARHFAANEAAGVRLWVEARDLGAIGYRLYLFYP